MKDKIFKQKLWIRKLNWDTIVDDEILLKSWHEFLEHITLLDGVRVPRYLFFNKPSQKDEIHGFADASMTAYGACIYRRSFYDNN